jgi:hypothetical protein
LAQFGQVFHEADRDREFVLGWGVLATVGLDDVL